MTTVDDARLEEYERRLAESAEGFRWAVERDEVGRVVAVGDGIARVRGLWGARLDEILRIDGGTEGLAFDLHPEEIGVVLLGAEELVGVGAGVRATGRVVSVPVGEGLLGRVIDPLGAPLDGKGELDAETSWPVERPAPAITERDVITEPLPTGLTVIDALFPVGRGQRELIIGDRGTGKSQIAIDTVVRQGSTGVICVYVLIGQKSSSVVQLLRDLESRGAMGHSVVVVAAAESPPGLRHLAPYSGASVAEYFRDRGEDALVVFDDLSRHAIAYRELSLLLRRPAGREAYPGDIFYVHSRLLERATRLCPESGGGSLTALPIAETQAGRISDFIPTNLISITDGQIYLDPTLFDRGVKPAVDVGLSVSRVGGKTQSAGLASVAGRLRLDVARFAEVEVFTRFGSRVEEGTRRLLVRGARIREILKQSPGELLETSEQVALLLALDEGLFDETPLPRVRARARSLVERLRSDDGRELLAGLEGGRVPTREDRESVRRALSASEEAR